MGTESKEKKQYGCGSVIIGTAVMYFLITTLADQPRTPAAPPTPRDYCQDTGLARGYSEEFVKARLRSPSTADFPFLENENSFATAVGDCTFVVLSYVDAQNAFGATVRSSYVARIKYDQAAEEWQLIELAMD